METKYWRTAKATREPRLTRETPYVPTSQDHSPDLVPEPITPRIFIERDYSEVIYPQFKIVMPQELVDMVRDPDLSSVLASWHYFLEFT